MEDLALGPFAQVHLGKVSLDDILSLQHADHTTQLGVIYKIYDVSKFFYLPEAYLTPVAFTSYIIYVVLIRD